MSTNSQRMGLKLNDGSDPFLRTDFVENFTTIDEYPGNWICTSTTRPSWGAGQAGMCITETDTRRTLLWNGSTFKEMLYAPAVWWGALRPNATLARSTTSSFTVGTFTVNRPGSLVAIATSEIALQVYGRFGVTTRVLIDGAVASFDSSISEFCETNNPWPSGSVITSNTNSHSEPTLGSRNISAGTHSIGIQATGSTSSDEVIAKLQSVRVLAIFANATDR